MVSVGETPSGPIDVNRSCQAAEAGSTGRAGLTGVDGYAVQV